LKTPILTLFALVAFAGNSVLCRLALDHYEMDASLFTAIRLVSGAIILSMLLLFTGQLKQLKDANKKTSLIGGFLLFSYAALFSYAYIQLDTATGALILFASVQLTMLVYQIIKQGKINTYEFVGTGISLFGFAFWMWPDDSPLPVLGIILMALSGIAWGLYSLNGRGSKTPKLDTSKNFITSIPFLLLLLPVFLSTSNQTNLETESVLLAITSGGVTSAIGYWIWYSVLPNLKIAMASVLQLTVPIIATIGGVIWVNEYPQWDFYLACLLILTGILLINRKTV
jgi:drug/metabolite transporter (DMT)-like permease